MLWHKDIRYRIGGFWRCAVKNRERCAASYAQNGDRYLQQRRDRYDTDPVYRIGKRLTDDRRSRQQTLARRRAALLQED